MLEAKNDFEVLDLTPQFIPDMGVLKKAYRKISLAVHPDKCLGFAGLHSCASKDIKGYRRVEVGCQSADSYSL